MITDIVDDNGGIPVLDHMQEPPMIDFNIMQAADPADLENCAHFIVGTVSARTEYEAAYKMESIVANKGPGAYYVVRRPTHEDIFVKRAN